MGALNRRLGVTLGVTVGLLCVWAGRQTAARRGAGVSPMAGAEPGSECHTASGPDHDTARELTPREKLDRRWLFVAIPVIAAVVGVLTGTVTVVVNVPRAAEVLGPVLDQVPGYGHQRQYVRLTSFRAGMSVGYLEANLGPAILTRRSPDGSLMDNTYRGDNYYAEAIVDAAGTVKLFSVTSCDPNFRPAFETPSRRTVVLQGSTFAAASEPGAAPRYFLSGATSPSYFYDVTYGGNPGLYKTWIVGVNTTCGWRSKPGYDGPDYPFDMWASADEDRVVFDTMHGWSKLRLGRWQAIPQVAAFRAGTYVNTYAETDIKTDPDELSAVLLGQPDPNPARFVAGPDPIRVRTLPGYRWRSNPSWGGF